ncbi:leucine carboxyl methyltransferase, partial [Teratosphaeria destructans]
MTRTMLRKALVASTLFNTLAHAAPTSRSTSSTYKLVADYSGPSFFDGWDFFTGADPTTGYVTYQSQTSALAKSLAGFISRPTTSPNGTTTTATSAYIGVDATTNLTGSAASGRASVRISTTATFSGGGLFVATSTTCPSGP